MSGYLQMWYTLYNVYADCRWYYQSKQNLKENLKAPCLTLVFLSLAMPLLRKIEVPDDNLAEDGKNRKTTDQVLQVLEEHRTLIGYNGRQGLGRSGIVIPWIVVCAALCCFVLI